MSAHLGIALPSLFLAQFMVNNNKYSAPLWHYKGCRQSTSNYPWPKGEEAVGDAPYPDTGMWLVRPDHYICSRRRICTIDSILRAAHLIGASGPSFLPQEISPSDSLHAFKSFYVNKYADHYSYEIAF